MNTAQNDDVEFIDIKEVRRISGFGTTKIYELANTGKFPKQVSLGTRTVRWIRSEVQQWARDKVNQSRGGQPNMPSDSK